MLKANKQWHTQKKSKKFLLVYHSKRTFAFKFARARCLWSYHVLFHITILASEMEGNSIQSKAREAQFCNVERTVSSPVENDVGAASHQRLERGMNRLEEQDFTSV